MAWERAQSLRNPSTLEEGPYYLIGIAEKRIVCNVAAQRLKAEVCLHSDMRYRIVLLLHGVLQMRPSADTGVPFATFTNTASSGRTSDHSAEITMLENGLRPCALRL